MIRKTSRQVADLLDQIDQTPAGPEERALLDEALNLARQASDEALEYQVRMRLTGSAMMTGDTETMLASFGWCLGRHDANPRKFPLTTDHGDLLWHFKWVSEVLVRDPRFSLEQCRAAEEDMATRYQRAGVGLSGVWQSRFSNAMHTGHLTEAGAFREARELAGEDDYSHCPACVRSEDADYFALIGDDVTALRLFDEIMDEELACGDEPERAQSKALLRLLRAGREDEAREQHIKGLRLAKANPDPFPLVVPHLEFCAVTGNQARGLALLERYLPGLGADPLNLLRRLDALRAHAVLLDAVIRAGHGELLVRNSDHASLTGILGAANGLRTVAQLAAASWAAAEQLSADFDARNGTDFYARELQAARALADEHWDLPFGGEVFVPDALPSQSEPADAAGWEEWVSDAMILNASPDLVLDRVRRGLAVHDSTRLRGMLVRVLQAADLPAEANQAQVEYLAALRADGEGHFAEVIERLGSQVDDLAVEPSSADPAAVASYRQAAGALAAKVQAELASLPADTERLAAAWLNTVQGNVLLRLGEPGQAATSFAAAAVAEQAAGRPGDFSRYRTAHCLLMNDDPAAVAELDDLLAGDDLSPAVAFLGHHLRAMAHGQVEEFDQGAAHAEAGLAHATAMGLRHAVIEITALAANLLSNADRDAEAAVKQQLLIRQLGLAGEDTTDAQFHLGRYQLWSGQVEAAIDTLSDVVEVEEASDLPADSRVKTFFHLGEAALNAGDFGRAYWAWGRVGDLTDLGDPDLSEERLQILFTSMRSRGLMLTNFEDLEALDDLGVALTAAERLDDPLAIAAVLGRRGLFRVQTGDADGLAEIERARQLALDAEAAWPAADHLDSRARALLVLGRFDEGIAGLLSAADEFAAVGDVQAAAAGEVTAAEALADAGRKAEAVPLLEQAASRLDAGSDQYAQARLRLGDLLEELGRLDEAAAVRAEFA